MNTGFYAQSFPEFGAERSGAPVTAYTRVADEPIESRSPVRYPHFVLSIDMYLSVDRQIVSGLRDGGIIVVNSTVQPDKVRDVLGLSGRDVKVAAVDATRIALEALGRNNPNTTVLGAFAAVSKIIPVDSIADAARRWFPGKVGEANADAVARGAREVTVV